MSIEIKKEDPLDFTDFDLYDEENSIEKEHFCSSASSSRTEKPQKSRERLSNPTPIEMPSFEEIMNIRDLNWRIALQRHKTTQELGNDSRTKIAKLIIKNIYERKFMKDGNYDLKMTSHNFIYLAETLVKIFPTEVFETYYCRGTKGKNSTGKLYNAFVNTRSEIIDCGLLEVNRRNTNKSDTVRPQNSAIQPYIPSPEMSKHPDAFSFCCSTKFDDVSKLSENWNACFDMRQKLLEEKTVFEYFHMFPYLKEPLGYQLFINDVKRMNSQCASVDRLELVSPKIFDRILRQFKGDSIPKSYMQMYQNTADPVVLSLILLPFLFTVVNKRSSTGAPKVTKQEMYNRFFPHFNSLTELEDFENTQNFTERPIQTCVIGNLNDRPYAIIRVFDTKYHFGSPRDGMNNALKIFLALKLDFPIESVQMYTFLKKFAFGLVDDEKDAKVYPQVETMINEFNLYIRNTQNRPF